MSPKRRSITIDSKPSVERLKGEREVVPVRRAEHGAVNLFIERAELHDPRIATRQILEAEKNPNALLRSHTARSLAPTRAHTLQVDRFLSTGSTLTFPLYTIASSPRPAATLPLPR